MERANPSYQIRVATLADIDTVVDLIACLLKDFNNQDGRDFVIDIGQLRPATERLINTSLHTALLAFSGSEAIGVLTLCHAFSIYNGGDYGVITELYVKPNHRSEGIGKKLLTACFKKARSRKWKKVEVGAPDMKAWPRTFDFYKNNDFEYKGPKLRIELH